MESGMLIQKSPPFVTLLLLISFGAVSAVLFTPALPEIKHYFGISQTLAELTVSLFLAGYAIGQLPYGAISNRFGRKPALFFAITLTMMGTIFCISSANFSCFPLLIVGRFLMALGSSAGLTLSFSIITDCYNEERSRQITSYLMLAFAIMPGLSITLGGFLVTHFPWQACFYCILCYCAILFILIMVAPETCSQKDLASLDLRSLTSQYLKAFKNSFLVICALIAGCTTTFIYIFTTKAPFITIKFLHMSPSKYGMLNLIPSVGMVLGSIISARLAKQQDIYLTIKQGIVIISCGVIAMLAGFYLFRLSGWILILPMPVIYFGLVYVYSNIVILGLSQVVNKAVSSSILSFINIGISFVSLSCLKLIPINLPIILPLSFLILLMAIIILYIVNGSRIYGKEAAC